MGPLRSSRAERVAAIIATGVSSTKTQRRRPRESRGTSSDIGASDSRGAPTLPQAPLQALQLPLVGLVVVAQAVEDAVQQQGLGRAVHAVPGLGGLAAGGGDGDQ